MPRRMTIEDAHAYLDGHINLETGVVNDRAGVSPTVAILPDDAIVSPRRLDPPSLDRMRRLLAFLGDPQLDLDVLHITGTNGKGSTARMAAALLAANGLTTGTYTSPHLSKLNERLAVNGKAIGDEDLAELIAIVSLAEEATGDRNSYFELVTAAALRWFGDLAVAAAVVEVGAGGRWDATNTVDGLVGVVTNVELDHMEWFGDTKEEIAHEKVGIVKPGSTLLIGDTDPGIVDLLRREASPLGAERMLLRGEDFGCDSNRLAISGRVLTLRTPTTSYPNIFVPMHGAHQGDNAAIALAAVEAFVGDPLHPDVVTEGFAAVENPGRMEIVSRNPLVILDGAHNPAGARALSAALDEEFAANPGRIIVIGLLKGRDPAAMLRALRADTAREVIVVAPPSPRAMDPSAVVAAATELGVAAIALPSIEAALERARTTAAPGDAVVVTGSLYLIGYARSLLR